MSKYRFSPEQKVALWRAYDGKCAYCHEPVRFLNVTIDHILPEHLEEKPKELQKLINRFNLGADFSINDYCNWVPVHFGCNVRKNSTIYETAPHYISIARSKTAKVHKEERRVIKNKQFDRALTVVTNGFKQGLASKSQVIELFENIKQAISGFYDPIVITFGMNVIEALDNGLLEEDVPVYYPELCDWLEQNLVKELETIISATFYYTEASVRDGETLSVRIAFVYLNLSELEGFKGSLWEVLDINYYSEVYGVLADGSEINSLERIL